MPSQSKYTSKLSQTRVLVLGGTSGIGFCVAEAALEHGAHVYVSSSRQPKLDATISRLQTSYPDKATHISGQVCDLSDPSALEANLTALLEAAAAEGKIDHIVFTAGDALKVTPIAEATVDSLLAPGNVRFLGSLMLAKLAPRYMCPGPGSSITFTGGSNSQKPMKGWTIVAAYGTALEGMTRGLAIDLAPIRVNLVSPGAVHTELFGEVGEEVLGKFREMSLTGEMGRPEDVAEGYLYAMKDRFVTGTVLLSDGGRVLK